MQAFFEAYDLTHLMCAELANDKGSLCALTRTCRALFKPSIFYLWRSIDSFEPLIACLPLDSWTEANQMGILTDEHTVVFPEIDFTRQDLQRYMNYAPLIREFHFKQTLEMRFLSQDLLRSFQKALGDELGVLSPNLASFAWLVDLDHWLAPKVHRQIPLTLSLFVGDSVKSLQCRLGRDLNIRMVLSTSGRLPNLQHLTFFGRAQDSFEESLTPYPWANLQSISLAGPSVSVIPHLARLPRLYTIRIKYMRDATLGPAAAYTVASDPSSFESLREIGVHGHELAYAAKVFSYLPPTNSVHYAHCSTSSAATPEECNTSIDILQSHLNTSTLQCLEIRDLINDGSSSFSEEYTTMSDDPEPYDDAVVDISPLFKFTELRALYLCVHPRALVTQTDSEMIPKCWPKIQYLDLCGTLPIGRLPSIDYTHLLQVVGGCKSLQFLGLPFNGTQLPDADDLTTMSLSVKTLRVCGSPLDSDIGQMEDILWTTFPRLNTLDFAYQPWLYIESPSNTLWNRIAEEMEVEVCDESEG